MSNDFADNLRIAFDSVLTEKFGAYIPPEPYITKTGIRHLDALLGGGFGSSLPIMLSSAPEVGKSSISVFLAKRFLEEHPQGFVAYVDTETASAGTGNNSGIMGRVKAMGIPEKRFQYNPLLINVNGINEFVESYAELKKAVETKIGSEAHVLIIVDSLAACPCSKALTADDPKEYIGLKARELAHNLEKIKQTLAFSKMTLILIDQVRANMQIDSGPYKKQDEKGVGIWNNIKSSSSSSALQHNLKQWLYISKKKELFPGSGMDINGWVLDVRTEKNKLCSSGIHVSLVFDKHQTLHKVFSEYLFLSEMTEIEKKYTGRNDKKLPYPLLIKNKGAYKCIQCIEPGTGKVLGESGSFYEKDLPEKYENDQEFRQLFDWAVETSVEERINKFLLKNNFAAENKTDEEIQQAEEVTK